MPRCLEIIISIAAANISTKGEVSTSVVCERMEEITNKHPHIRVFDYNIVFLKTEIYNFSNQGRISITL